MTEKDEDDENLSSGEIARRMEEEFESAVTEGMERAIEEKNEEENEDE